MDKGFKIIRDTITPGLASLIRASGRTREILEAMGLALVGVTKRAFGDAGLRPAAWAPVKRSGQPLRQSGALWQSIRMTSLTNTSVTVGTDRPYAVFHQFGTKPYAIRPKSKAALFWPGAKHPVRKVDHPGLPARPFFPFTSSGEMTDSARRRVEAAGRAKLRGLIG